MSKSCVSRKQIPEKMAVLPAVRPDQDRQPGPRQQTSTGSEMLALTSNRLVAKTLPGMSEAAKKIDGIPTDLLLRRRAARRLLIDGRAEKNCVALIRELPAEGESLHFVIDGHFEPCHLIPVTRKLVSPKVISRLDITTLSFNLDNVACIENGLLPKHEEAKPCPK